MALTPVDETHALQIQAGTLGRKAGHEFEDRMTKFINELQYPLVFDSALDKHLHIGEPAYKLLNYIASTHGESKLLKAVALSTGALATSEEGKKWLEVNGVTVRRCKSDLIVTAVFPSKGEMTFGVSTKQCNNNSPTNAQLYFTTARGFANLLNTNGIAVSDRAISALRQFCGDQGFRPLDNPVAMQDRKADPRRFFWEEIDEGGRREWERTIQTHQDSITRLLLQKAYMDDPFSPDFLIHKTRKAESWPKTEVALYGIDELICHSRAYGGFSVKPYSVKKGSHKDPPGVTHSAPRFGIVQMQRGGQAQHPEQLQFNLEAGYFYKIKNVRPDVLADDAGQ